MDSSSPSNARWLVAVVGGGALIAAGAISMAIHQEQAGPETVATSQMTVGSTTTQATPPKVEATSMAVPTMKGPAPLPSEQQSAE